MFYFLLIKQCLLFSKTLVKQEVVKSRGVYLFELLVCDLSTEGSSVTCSSAGTALPSMAFLCPLLMDLLSSFSGFLALGRGAVQTYEPVVKVPENNRELGGAAMVGLWGWWGWGEREVSRGRLLGEHPTTWCFGSIYCCCSPTHLDSACSCQAVLLLYRASPAPCGVEVYPW